MHRIGDELGPASDATEMVVVTGMFSMIAGTRRIDRHPANGIYGRRIDMHSAVRSGSTDMAVMNVGRHRHSPMARWVDECRLQRSRALRVRTLRRAPDLASAAARLGDRHRRPTGARKGLRRRSIQADRNRGVPDVRCSLRQHVGRQPFSASPPACRGSRG